MSEVPLCECPPPWNNDYTPSPLCPAHSPDPAVNPTEEADREV